MKLNNKWIPVGTLVVVLAIGGMSAEAGQRENRGRERNGRASQGEARSRGDNAQPQGNRTDGPANSNQTGGSDQPQADAQPQTRVVPSPQRRVAPPPQPRTAPAPQTRVAPAPPTRVEPQAQDGWRRHGLEPGRDRAFSPAPALKPSGPSSTPCRDTRVLCGRTTARFTRRPGSVETRMTRVITATTTVIATRVTGITGIPIPRYYYRAAACPVPVPLPRRHYYGSGRPLQRLLRRGVVAISTARRTRAGLRLLARARRSGAHRLLRRRAAPGAAARRRRSTWTATTPASSTTSTARSSA